jgi:Cys-tRNA(Pro) deacylase
VDLMAKKSFPVTAAVRHLKDKGIEFISHTFKYEEKGGTRQSAEELGVDEHDVIKTLVFETDAEDPLIVLMHGDMEVSEKELARQLSVKNIKPVNEQKALKLTGYQFGGTSPFGTRQKIDTFAEETIFSLDKIYINCGKRGFLAEMIPNDIEKAIDIKKVNVAIKK